LDEIDISTILVEDLREDASGSMIKEMSDLAYHACREPPWNDDLGVDLMRRSAGISGRLIIGILDQHTHFAPGALQTRLYRGPFH
jgi:hypothetical protein